MPSRRETKRASRGKDHESAPCLCGVTTHRSRTPDGRCGDKVTDEMTGHLPSPAQSFAPSRGVAEQTSSSTRYRHRGRGEPLALRSRSSVRRRRALRLPFISGCPFPHLRRSRFSLQSSLHLLIPQAKPVGANGSETGPVSSSTPQRRRLPSHPTTLAQSHDPALSH